MLEIFEKLSEIVSVSGRERKLAERVAELVEPYADEVRIDTLGNVIAFKKGLSEAPKKLMITAHTDEVGFTTTYIEENGRVRVSPVGCIDVPAAAFSQVVFSGGAVGLLIPDGKVEGGSYYIDLGACSKEQAEKLVSPGETASVRSSLFKMENGYISGRPFDDKLCCAVLIEAMKRLKDVPNDLYFVFTTQEEIGSRGAAVAVNAIEPDIGIAVDGTFACDSYGPKAHDIKLGGGAAIKIRDNSLICSEKIVEKMIELAKKHEVKYQLELLEGGGCDAGVMQSTGKGTLAGSISVPMRHMHTPREMANISDLDECMKLLILLCEDETL
ncbi:MAG: M42 family metallopeptidase [Firmicutes bacterium]|nr:M42 family metallopeptidase [Bacillota bacterium]